MTRNIVYSLTCLFFTIVIGGAVYEHLAVVPQWAAGPPASLSMFQGEYGLKAENFWIPIHPCALLLFITSIIMHWKTERKNNLLITALSYVAILIITRIYFVPELLSITGTPFSLSVDPSLAERGAMWEILSLVRLGVLIVLALILFLGLSKSQVRVSSEENNRAAKRKKKSFATA